MVRPAGRNDFKVKVLYSPGKGKSELYGRSVAGHCESGGSRRQSTGLMNRKLRYILWRQRKKPYTRGMNLMKAGLTEEHAFRSAFNQRGPW